MSKPASQRFQKDGEISQISKEQFNRYKGTEWFFTPRDIDGHRMVLGYIGSYPDDCPSYFAGDFYALDYDTFCQIWDTSPERNIYRLGEALKTAMADMLSHERYQAMLRTGQAVPRCEHCRQTIL